MAGRVHVKGGVQIAVAWATASSKGSEPTLVFPESPTHGHHITHDKTVTWRGT